MARDERRRDPGEFYPGGKVWVRPGQSQPQGRVTWEQIEGKPQIAPLPDRYRESDMKGKINEIASKFALAAAAALIGWAGCADVSVTTKRLDELWNDDQVVVDVTGIGVDTNAVRDISREEISPATNRLYKALIDAKDGAARALPKYLHTYDAADSYPEAAQEYYLSRGDGKVDGGCSAVRAGGFLYRNFDYPFDERAEFVVKMSAGKDRFASVGVAQVGTNLTEQMVTSGKWSKWYKALPGATVDGINERGVCAEINVVDTPVTGWSTTGNLHPLAAVRWILDYATNAQHGAEYIASHIAFPAGWTQNFHWMIADEHETWIVENGAAHQVTNGVPAMTNFRLYGDHKDTTGEGQERYDILVGGGAITSAWFTFAYRRETNPPWVSDLEDVLAYTNEIFDAWAAHDKEYFRSKTNNGIPWWQTVHTSVYDISNRVLRVAVQERDDWYTFQVPSSGGGIADEQDPVALPRVVSLEAEVAAIPRITESNDHEGWAKNADYAVDSDYATEARKADEVGGYTGGDFDGMYERIAENTESISTNAAALESHVADTNSNPHDVTAGQVGAYSKTETDMKLEGKVNAKGGGDLDGQYGICGSLTVGGWLTVYDDATEDQYYTDVLSQGIMISHWGAEEGVERVYYDPYGVGLDFADGRPSARIFIPLKSGTFALLSDIPPPPGDYAAVSNAAMNAETRSVANAAAIASHTSQLSQQSQSIAAETTRATSAELALQAQIDLFKSFTAIVTNALPATGEDGCVYLVPIPGTENKAEWLWVHEPSNHWEKIGTTAIDMAEYVKEGDLPSILDPWNAKAPGAVADAYYTKTYIDAAYDSAIEEAERRVADHDMDVQAHPDLRDAVSDIQGGKVDKVTGADGDIAVFDEYGNIKATGINTIGGDNIELFGWMDAHNGYFINGTLVLESVGGASCLVSGLLQNRILIPDQDGTIALTSDVAAAATAATNYTDSVLGPISTILDAILGGH